MEIRILTLKNFRSFELFRIELERDITLVVGRNATGKTAVLDGLAVAMGAWLRGTRAASGEDRALRPSDVRLIRQESQGLPTTDAVYPTAVEAYGTVFGEYVEWSRELLRAGGRTTTGNAKEVRGYAAEMERYAATTGEGIELPLLAYYGTGRLWVQKYDRQPKRLGARMQGYAACLEIASNTKLFQRWMAWREQDRIQRIAAAHEHGADLSTVTSPHLEAVTAAVQSCIPGVSRFFYSANHKELRVEFVSGQILPFEQLSDGQRSLVVLAADIAWRAAQLNPHLGAAAPRDTEGVVLIDEIELHLHPAWQRDVIGWLRSAFPKIQFVITTHSPQVIASAEQRWLRVLGDDGARRSAPTEGRDSNAILRDVMGVPERPVAMQRKLARIESLIEDGELNEARTLLTEVKESVGDNDRDVMTLEWELVAESVGDVAD